MNKEAANFEAIAKAKKHHDSTCPWKGEGQRIYMTAFDIERMGWEEGDTIAGLVLMIDTKLTTGRFRVECDAEPKPDAELAELVEVPELVTA